MDGARASERSAWYRSELVVALEHHAEVLRLLRRWGVGLGDASRHLKSRDLGLALIPLHDDDEAAEQAAAALERDADRNEAVAARVRRAAGHADAADTLHAAVEVHLQTLTTGMDRVLWAVRTSFAAMYEEWTPTLGKNRLVENVEGGGNISHNSPSAILDVSDWRPEPRWLEPGRGVRVGVLDTLITPHPWLAGGWVAPAADQLDPESPYPALAGHATFVAGLVLRRAPGCVLEVRGALGNDGIATSWEVANGIVELGRTGLDVLNLSLGCYTEDGQPPLVLATAVDRLDTDIVVVAAAGNHGDIDLRRAGDGLPAITAADRRKPSWPAALDDVVAVGAAAADRNERASFTPDGLPWIDVLADGEAVSSTFLDGEVAVPQPDRGTVPQAFEGYASWSGTSFAAALVSGEIARRTERARRTARQAWWDVLEELDRNQPGARPPVLRLL